MQTIVKHTLAKNPCQKVRETCLKVDQKLVKINDGKIDEFVTQLRQKVEKEGLAYDKWSDWHLDNIKDYTIEQLVSYVFVVDSFNFCFWPDNKAGVFEYAEMTGNLAKVLKDDPQFFTCDRLMEVDEQQLREKVFNTELPFCLVDERARIVSEVAAVVKARYNSSFLEFVQASDFDCPTLVDMIVTNFSGFRDEAIYDGRQVFFYKRAQILVADLVGVYQDLGQEPFKNKAELTMFADYRVPQILRHVGIFEYSEELATKIDTEQEMPYSGIDEIQIRAQTVNAVEKIISKIRADDFLVKHVKNSYEVDWLLWQMGERSLDSMKPHHKVLSIFY